MAGRSCKISIEEMRSDLHLLRIEISNLIDNNLDNSSCFRNLMERYTFYLKRAKKKKQKAKVNLDCHGSQIVVKDKLVEFMNDLKPARYDFDIHLSLFSTTNKCDSLLCFIQVFLL